VVDCLSSESNDTTESVSCQHFFQFSFASFQTSVGRTCTPSECHRWMAPHSRAVLMRRTSVSAKSENLAPAELLSDEQTSIEMDLRLPKEKTRPSSCLFLWCG